MQSASERRIGKGWTAPIHQPSKAIPASLPSLSRETRAALARRANGVVKQLTRRLGKPYINEAGFILYNEDCRKVMAAMKEASILADLTLTSPPYNIGKEYEQSMPLDAYLQWCENWLADIWSATSDIGSLWLNLGYVPVPDKGRAVPLAPSRPSSTMSGDIAASLRRARAAHQRGAPSSSRERVGAQQIGGAGEREVHVEEVRAHAERP